MARMKKQGSISSLTIEGDAVLGLLLEFLLLLRPLQEMPPMAWTDLRSLKSSQHAHASIRAEAHIPCKELSVENYLL